MEIFDLFNTGRFVPRAQCGNWTAALIYLHNISDFFIWTAYIAIPVVLIRFAYRRKELPFQQLFWLFGLFIVACGTTHLLDIILFYKPVYILSGWVKLITAAASWGTVIALFHVVPRALLMKSPDALEAEVARRVAELQELNAQLAAANTTKDDLLRREQESRQQAEAANRSKDEFLATVSHELRTPLTSILGWSALLATGNHEDASVKDAMAAIERNARAQTQIVDDLLDVSRIITGQMKLETVPLDVPTLIANALHSVYPAARAKNIALVTLINTPESTATINGDEARLKQVIWNLVSNAVKFTPKGGHVEVALERENSQLLIRVSDNGIGIAPEFLPHVFERFRQSDSSTTRTYGGLGLGLAIARHLVEMHGGTIEAESHGIGQGATFTVRMPILAVNFTLQEGEQRTAITSPLPQGNLEGLLQGLRLLVIEDDTDSRQLIRTVLELHGARVESVGTAHEGFKAVCERRPDVIVCDIGLPGEDGYRLMERIRQLPPDEGGLTPAIALTAYVSPRDRLLALSAGFQVHLPKPIQPEFLVSTVAELSGRAAREHTASER